MAFDPVRPGFVIAAGIAGGVLHAEPAQLGAPAAVDGDVDRADDRVLRLAVVRSQRLRGDRQPWSAAAASLAAALGVPDGEPASRRGHDHAAAGARPGNRLRPAGRFHRRRGHRGLDSQPEKAFALRLRRDSHQAAAEGVLDLLRDASNAYGFQLRSDSNAPARTGMLGLLRDGFNYGWHVWIDYDAPPGHHNGTLFRVWVTK